MKNGIIAIVSFIFILLIIFIAQIYMGNRTIDVHLHDTYFVINYWTFIMLCVLILTFAVSLTTSVILRFQNKLNYWLLLLSSLGLSAFFIYYYFLFKRYR